MRYLIAAMLIVVGVIHLLPLSGAIGPERLAELYGLTFAEPNLAILMRHRAVLFGLLGSLLVAAAFRPGLQVVAFVAGWVSVSSFLALASSTGGYNAQIGRVVTADVVAAVCLLIGTAAFIATRRRM